MIRWLPALLVLVLLPMSLWAGPTRPSDRFLPNPDRWSWEEQRIPAEAHVHGKYRGLLRVLYVPQDLPAFERFHDWGHWNGTDWAGYRNLPAGFWVYVHPHWYIWESVTPGR
jgi:hypothetical protein